MMFRLTGAAEAGAVTPLARPVAPDWHRLSAPTARPARFDPAMVADLPEPARRYLTHAIAPGVPLWQSVVLTMRGHIRIGAWRPFTARQVLAPPAGFIWAATARFAGLPVTGFDRYSSGSGQMRWRLLGVLPVMTGSGPDVTRSAAGRLAGETLCLPTAFRSAAWTAAPDPDVAVASWQVGVETAAVEVHLGPDGALLGGGLARWGNPAGAPYDHYPFGITVETEQTHLGVTVPDAFRAGWWWGTDRQDEGEFFRARITTIEFR